METIAQTYATGFWIMGGLVAVIIIFAVGGLLYYLATRN
jgi:hypothetical protein